jgi:hypothetical protein
MHSKKCTSCGNDNDPLLSNCLFCKSSLPVIDLNSIPNEVLVMNAAEWIGKLKEGWYNAKAPNVLPRMVLKGEIQGNALRYLSLLEIRASTSINLVNTVNNLRADYIKYEKTMPSNQKIALGFFVLLVAILLSLFIRQFI